MSRRFQELDWRTTPMGELVLRRRWDPAFGKEVHEIKLDDEYLMSSLFTVAEEELARRGLARCAGSGLLDVAVGGLGLGFTAITALADPRLRSLAVIDALPEVIEWHRRGLIPAGATLTADERCTLVRGDFFALVRDSGGLDPDSQGRRFHAILVDIDHSPRHHLHPSHAAFYQPAGLATLVQHLHPGGVFGLWSNDSPDDDFTAALRTALCDVTAEIITFRNPLQGRDATATLYLASAPEPTPSTLT